MMNRLQNAMLFSSIGVVAFDAAASVAALLLDFDYSRVAVGSWALYATAGFIAGRGGDWWHGIATGIAMGLTDATAGWAVSWVIGPGRLPDNKPLTQVLWIGTAITVTIIAAVISGVGGAIGRATAGARSSAA